MDACGWEYPDPPHTPCAAPWTLTLRCRPTGEIAHRCLNHAMREVWGGQWEYVDLEEASHE